MNNLKTICFDFQEFMSQLMGANVNNLPPPVVEHGLQHELQQLHQPQQQQQYQQQQQNGVRISTPTGTMTKSNNKMPSMANPMNTRQYNTPQPLYSQVPLSSKYLFILCVWLRFIL